MKHVFLFNLLILLVCMVSVAEETVVVEADCSKQPLSAFLTDEAIRSVEKLTVSGPLVQEDLALINSCKKLTVLDLTNAELKVIPENAFTETSVETLYLPKDIELFNLNAVSLFLGDLGYFDYFEFKKPVEIIVSGTFPQLANPTEFMWLKTYGFPMEFKLAAGNDLYVEKNNCILTKDMKTLVKANRLYSTEYGYYDYDNYEVIAQRNYFDVEQVNPFAFTYSLVGGMRSNTELTFSKRLKSIGAHSFDYMGKQYEPVATGLGQTLYSSFIFEGMVPPVLEGDVFNTTEQVHRFKKVVPYVKPYVEAGIQWAGAMDAFDYGVLKGEEYKYNRDSYIEYIKWEYEKMIKAQGIVEEKDTTVFVTMDVIAPSSVTANVFVGASNQKETVLCPINDGSMLSVALKVYDKDGIEMASVDKSCIPGETISFNTELPYVPKDDVCFVKAIVGCDYWTEEGGDPEAYTISYVDTRVESLLYNGNSSQVRYDLQGREQITPTHGIYIQNDKKVIIK